MASRYQVIILPEAEQDLRELLHHVRAQSPQAADRLFTHLLAAIDGLSIMPARFPAARESGQVLGDIRQRVKKSFRIIYEIRGQVVEVIGIRHAARRPMDL